MQRQEEKKIEVSATAKIVLAVKELYKNPGQWPGKRTKPLYCGEHKHLFLTTTDMMKAKERKEDPNVLQDLAVRERWFNKIYHAAIKKENIQQIIILGSGFDTRPYQCNSTNQQGKSHAEIYKKVKFFEVDCAANLKVKEEIFNEKGLDKNAEYICTSYTDDDFLKELKTHGINFTIPTLVMMEGNSMYLELPQITKLFQNLRDNFSKITIAFDYFSRDLIENPNSFCYALNKMGLWKTGFNLDDLHKLADKCKLNMIRTESIKELEKQYEVNDNPPHESEHYHCAVLTKKS